MLGFAIFAVTFVTVLIIAVIYLYPSSKKVTTVPGLNPTSKQDGNRADIERAGSLHEFLIELHADHGPISSFWLGQELVISIASPDLFNEHKTVFDRPPSLFSLFEPLIGPDSIQYANKVDGRSRRKLYDKCFSHEASVRFYGVFQQVTDNLAEKWKTLLDDQHIPLHQHMIALAIKVIAQISFGEYFDDDANVLELRRNYDICWGEMEETLMVGIAEQGSERYKRFIKARDAVHNMVRAIVNTREDKNHSEEDNLFIDVLCESTKSEQRILNDATTFIVGGFHTSGNLLTWAFYFLASHQDCQDRLAEEIADVLGEENASEHTLSELIYLRQVINETLRCSVLAPWAARFQEFDSELGGHKIPKNTPVIHALGVMLQDEEYWPNPKRFDPDRFSMANMENQPSMAFQPFGFAGKRKCPGVIFAYLEVSVVLITLIRKFKIKMVEGQVVTPVHHLITSPEEEIWVTLEPRK